MLMHRLKVRPIRKLAGMQRGSPISPGNKEWELKDSSDGRSNELTIAVVRLRTKHSNGFGYLESDADEIGSDADPTDLSQSGVCPTRQLEARTRLIAKQFARQLNPRALFRV